MQLTILQILCKFVLLLQKLVHFLHGDYEICLSLSCPIRVTQNTYNFKLATDSPRCTFTVEQNCKRKIDFQINWS